MKLGRKNRPIIGKRAVRASRTTALRRRNTVSAARRSARPMMRSIRASKSRTAKRSIMAGAGSGITLVLKDLDITNIPNDKFYGDFGGVNGWHPFLEPENGTCTGVIEIESIGTYYDGGNPGLGDIPVDIKVEGVYPDDDEDAKAVFEAGLKEVIYDSEIDDKKIQIGGGWTRSSFRGSFKVDLYAPSFYSTISLIVTIPDKELVDWLDKFANGETDDFYYDICINGDYLGNYYENEQDAIETAKEYAADPQYADDEITVVIEHYNTNYDGDIMDYFDDNGDVVWSSEDDLY